MDMIKLLQISFLCLLSFALSIPSAHAQYKTDLSTSEDVAITFYKTGKIRPDFENWVSQNPPYTQTPWAKRGAVMDKEKQRLMRKYRELNLSKDTIRLRTFANVELEAKKEFDETGEEIIKYYRYIKFINGPDAYYFPYAYAAQNYAVMPFGLQNILTKEIDEATFLKYSEEIKPHHEFTFLIDMTARESMTQAPIELDTLEQWILKTNIASAELWDKNNALTWEYTAPWYVSPELEKIQNIYDLKPTHSKKVGDVKPFINKSQ